MWTITDDIHEKTATDGITAVTVTKCGDARLFKRNGLKKHNPKDRCTTCGGDLEEVFAKNSRGKLIGRHLYCNHCEKESTPFTEHVVWLVAKIDDVFVYVKDNHIIVTKKDLNP